MYVDVHNHLYYAASPSLLVRESLEKGVELIVVNAEDEETSKKSLTLADGKHVFAAIGIHPSKRGDPSFLHGIISERVVAIGEIGIDAKYERYGIRMEEQRKRFREQLLIAKEYDLPVIVHSGRSWKEALVTVMSMDVKADFHWYSGSVRYAVEWAESGYYFSLGPAVIKYPSYDALVRELPLSSILTETDYPVRIVGDPHPADVIKVVSHISGLRDMDERDLARSVRENARRFLGV